MPLSLDKLIDDDFISDALLIASAPPVFERLIRNNPLIAKLTNEISAQSTDADVEVHGFVQSLLDQFERGVRFKFDASLAALSVVLESRATDATTKLLEELAAVEIAEMTLAPKVAKIVIRNRRLLIPSTTFRPIDLSAGFVIDLNLYGQPMTWMTDMVAERPSIYYLPELKEEAA